MVRSSEYEYEYRPRGGLSTRKSGASRLLAAYRTRTRTRTQRSGTRTRRLLPAVLDFGLY